MFPDKCLDTVAEKRFSLIPCNYYFIKCIGVVPFKSEKILAEKRKPFSHRLVYLDKLFFKEVGYLNSVPSNNGSSLTRLAIFNNVPQRKTFSFEK